MPKRAASSAPAPAAKVAKKTGIAKKARDARASAPEDDDVIRLDDDAVPVAVAKKAAKREAAKIREKVAGAFGRDKDTLPRVIYIGHVPHGFYEDQMRAYFGQFGDVTRLRLSRNKKTGASKHYAYVEFKHPEVAAIVAEAMDNYLLFESVLKVRLMAPEECHAELWKGANRKFKKVPWRTNARETHDRERDERGEAKRAAGLLRNERKRRKAIAAAGIEYDFPGYAAAASGAGEGGKEEKGKKKKAEKAEKAEKATPAKRKAAATTGAKKTPAAKKTRGGKD